MKFIVVATSLLIIGFAYVNGVPVDPSTDVVNHLDRAINPAMRELERENSRNGNLGASVNSLKTIIKGKLIVTDQFLL